MKKEITRINPHQAGKLSAITMAAFSLLFWPFILMAQIFAKAAGLPAQQQLPAFFNYLFLCLPFFYAIMGYVMTAIMCLVYNFVAKYVGGIRIDLKDIEEKLLD